MKHFLLLNFLLAFAAFAYAQKGKPVKIIDPGELYSTYEFTEDEKAELKKQVKEAEYDKILNHYTEKKWPAGIDDLNERTDNPDKIKQYKVWIIATLQDKYVLKIPSAKNKHMPDEMVDDFDFYFVIGKSGVEN